MKRTLEKGLCFFVPWMIGINSNVFCSRKAIKMLRDIDGNGCGIFCEQHLRVMVKYYKDNLPEVILAI